MNKINAIAIYALLAAITGYLVFGKTQKDKIVYVDNLELFSAFHMKTELEKKYTEVESQRKAILDSIYTEIRMRSELKDASAIESLTMLKKEFLMKKELFEKENTQAMADYNTQIWNQLNEYTKQFGKEHGYEFILGANGQGVLMYADDVKNVTKELLQFANSKFDGK